MKEVIKIILIGLSIFGGGSMMFWEQIEFF
jgi:hypothetical protein